MKDEQTQSAPRLKAPPRLSKKVLCGCGSGRRHKHCCGQTQRRPLARVEVSRLVALIRAHRYVDLETAACELLDRDPNCGVAWKAWGIAQSVQGKPALHTLEMAARLLPNDAEAHSNLGNALHNAGRFEESVTSCHRALRLNPAYAGAHNNLGNALLGLGKSEEAALAYRRALELKPDFVDAHCNLGNAQRLLGQLEEAEASYRRGIAVSSDVPLPHFNLGNVLLARGDFDAAAQSFRRATSINPRYAEAHNNLGVALRELGRLDQALASYRRAVNAKPNYPEAHNNLGLTLRDLGATHEALASFRRALEIKADYAEAYCNLALALRQLGQGAAAEDACRRALAIAPVNATALSTLAELFADQGRFAQAEQVLGHARALDPDSLLACVNFPRVRKMSSSDTNWLTDALRLAAQPLPPRKAASLRYALGKYFDDVGDYATAFAHFQLANQLTRCHKAPYDRRQLTQSIDAAIRMFDAAWLRAAEDCGSASERPVFIVGMPRSGTSLTEQVLCAHPSVFGAGELTFWKEASDRYLQAVLGGEANERLTGVLANDYLELLAKQSPDALRVIDKMPGNFLLLGLIRAAFPHARILHMRRHPIDTCLSIHFQNFEVTHSYANDLEDLAHYYSEYARLMQHWRATLPAGAILDVPYEDFVAQPQAWNVKLLEFVGLPWNTNCLRLNETQRNVLTASKWQVRQPITSSAVGRWRHYEAFIGPLLTLL